MEKTENLGFEESLTQLSPRYRVMIADLEKGCILMDKRIYGFFGSVVSEDKRARCGYAVSFAGVAGHLSFKAHGLAIKALAANLRGMKRKHRRLWLMAITGKRGEKGE